MIIFDCEIIKGILGKGEEPEPGIEYCGGWRDFENMGISVIGAYDYDTDRYRVFCADNFSEFQEMVNDASVVIGFNSQGFDNPLCRANGIDVPDETSWDLLAEIWAGAGLSREFQYPTHLGFGLDACSAVNFCGQKSGHGAQAPVDWQRGQVGRVIDYCLHDVRLTKALVDRVMECGFLLDPRNSNQAIHISLPLWLR